MTALYFAEYLREFRSTGKLAIDSAVIVRHGDGEEGFGQEASTMMGVEPSVVARPSLADRELDPRTLGLVFPLVKRPGNAFDYISVGRTSNVDVMLPLQQVSKFHAYFSKQADGEYTLADGGSKNGTRIGARALEVRVPSPVKSGDRIYFGPYAFWFFGAPQFQELIATKSR
jgi:hypothetical protein